MNNLMSWRLGAGQVTQLAGITYRQLDWWIHTEIVQCADPAAGRGCDRGYSVYDLIAIRAAAGLRKEGASLQAIRKAVDALRAKWGIDSPLHSGRMLVINGRVYFVESNTDIWDVLRGQLASNRFFTLDASELARDTIERVTVIMAA